VIFLHPQWLALLALPVILAFYEWVRPGPRVALPFDHARPARGWFGRGLILAANCLPAGLLAVAILFLAHPVTFQPPEVERQLTNVQIVLDTSGSMTTPYGPQTDGKRMRFDAAMESTLQFIRYRKGDAFGLTIFSRNFIHWVPLTQDVEAIALARPFISPNVFPESLWGGTLIGKALLGASEHLAEQAQGDRMIILITDGESNDIKPPKDSAVLAELQARGVRVFAILMTDKPVEPALIGIARSTGGEAFNAVTPEALQSVFKRIDEMKKVVVLQKQPKASDYYDPFFVPALALLVAAVLALFGLRYNPW
jgi:Ca-activated chloride channel family protein